MRLEGNAFATGQLLQSQKGLKFLIF